MKDIPSNSALSSVPKKYVQRYDTAISPKSDGIVCPLPPSVPGITFLKGCNVINYNVTFTGSNIASADQTPCKCTFHKATELMEGRNSFESIIIML